ncbi:MAG: arylsulfatase [Planctomycetota bacterium]
MSNRVLTHALLATCASVMCFSANGLAADRSDARPNIIYIMCDDLGYGDLGCYGQKVIQTPSIDQLARQGMRFTDHYAGHTVCRPSRLVLWTGQHVGHTGLIGNAARRFTGMEATVAKQLKAAGYATGGVGKWAMGHVEAPEQVDNPGHPNLNGFDYWFGYLNQSNAHNFYPTFLWENRTQVPLPGNVIGDYPKGRGRVSSVRKTYSHDRITEAALDFIRKHQAEPFLLHVHWTIPHANNEGGRVLGDGMEVPDYGIYSEQDWPNPEKGFAAMITRMDGDVGRILSLLDELHLDNTIIFFTSDNGPHQEGGHQHQFFDSNGPLTGFKRSMHEGGIRVPMIVHWPGKIAPGSESSHPSAFWDFLPTACELAGAEFPQVCDGISYVPTLLGQNDQQGKHDFLYWASSEGKTSIGIRRGDWKLVRYRGVSGSRGDQAVKSTQETADWRLYSLPDDPAEQDDLAERYPNVVGEILSLVRQQDLDLGD